MTVQTIIDLSLGDQTHFENNEYLFHKKMYRRLSQEIKENCVRNKNNSKPIDTDFDSDSKYRIHNTILLNGARGTGKTSILINLPKYMAKEPDFKEIRLDILFIDPVDPTLLDGHEDFLNIVIGQINNNKELKAKLEKIDPRTQQSYYGQLEKLANALEHEQRSSQEYGLDRMLAYQGGLEIAELTHQYFCRVLKITEKKLLVLSIDDVDMSLHHGYNVLEVVRKQLCSSAVLPIVSGDIDLYLDLTHNKFAEQLVNSNRTEEDKKNQQDKSKELAKEYLRKVFPLDLRFNVPTIADYLSPKKEDDKIAVILDGFLLENLDVIHEFLLVVINGRVNGEENSELNYSPKTARELIQWLRVNKSFLRNVKYISEKEKYGKNKHQDEENKNKFTLREQIINWWLIRPKSIGNSKKDIATLYHYLANYFYSARYMDLYLLCNDLQWINENRDTFTLTQITYLNPLAQLQLATEVNTDRQNENYFVYGLDKKAPKIVKFSTQGENLPEELQQEEAPLISALPAFEPIDKELYFKKPLIKQITAALENRLNENQRDAQEVGMGVDVALREFFLLRLFSYDDYYSSYQSAAIIFFGRFFELITTSLMRDIDSTWLKQLFKRAPYFSILSIASAEYNEETEKTEDDPEPSVAVDDNDPNSQLNSYLEQLSKEINTFRENAGLNHTIFCDLALFAAVQNKYFNEVNRYKSAEKKFVKDLEGKQILINIFRRAAYGYWAALGSFEKRPFYFNDSAISDRVMHQNVFAVDKPVSDYVDNRNLVYHHNIAPFLARGTPEDGSIKPYTQLLASHPIFQLLKVIEDGISSAGNDSASDTQASKSTKKRQSSQLSSIEADVDQSDPDIKIELKGILQDISNTEGDIAYAINRIKAGYNNKIKNTSLENYADQLLKNPKIDGIFKKLVGTKQKLGVDQTTADSLPSLILKFWLNSDPNQKDFIAYLTELGVPKDLASSLAERFYK